MCVPFVLSIRASVQGTRTDELHPRAVQNRKNWPSYVVWANGPGEDDFSPSTYAMESLLNDYTDATKAGVGVNCRTFDLLSYFCIASVSDLERLWRKVKTLTDADVRPRSLLLSSVHDFYARASS